MIWRKIINSSLDGAVGSCMSFRDETSESKTEPVTDISQRYGGRHQWGWTIRLVSLFCYLLVYNSMLNCLK